MLPIGAVAEAEEDFATRPRPMQLAICSAQQSAAIACREVDFRAAAIFLAHPLIQELIALNAEVEATYQHVSPIPRPP